ncbi:MAG: hypothetical protein LBR53_10435 [Deltaproteobacteria bacterium]|jgi:hypothetical protein|nr:hypothetical protein [Deltaproteobacteria bacterium]
MAFSPFKITAVEVHPAEELFRKLREVVMLRNREIRPYEDAELSLERMPFEEFRPAQRYVLVPELQKVRHLGFELRDRGQDPADLDGYLTLRIAGVPEPVDLLPPVIERHTEADGTAVNVVNDGMHRLYAARLEWRTPRVLYAKNLPPECPYYAYPIPGPFPWEKVEIVNAEKVPEGFLKKWHRIRNNKELYRDFNSAFQNVGGPRGGGAA